MERAAQLRCGNRAKDFPALIAHDIGLIAVNNSIQATATFWIAKTGECGIMVLTVRSSATFYSLADI